MSRPLYRTTIVIWSEYDPTDTVELDELARDAVSGESYCSRMDTKLIHVPHHDAEWDGTEFFGVESPDDSSEKVRDA